jgi:hypothetical protein
MNRLKTHITLILFIGCGIVSHAQRVKILNLPNYDKEKLHFGFSLGINHADFALYPASDALTPDSILNVTCTPDLGINLGIISELRLHEYATLRFLPAISLQGGRTINYDIDSIQVPGTTKYYSMTKKVESTLLDFPINLKIRSERLNNMSAYLLVGAKYSLDLASQQKTVDPEIVKLKKHDLALEAGVGFDFYLTFFKLSTEIKFSSGIQDRLYHENTKWVLPIEKLNSKVWLISINFEG